MEVRLLSNLVPLLRFLKTTFMLYGFADIKVRVIGKSNKKKSMDIRLLSNLVSLLRYNFSISVTLNAERGQSI